MQCEVGDVFQTSTQKVVLVLDSLKNNNQVY